MSCFVVVDVVVDDGVVVDVVVDDVVVVDVDVVVVDVDSLSSFFASSPF